MYVIFELREFLICLLCLFVDSYDSCLWQHYPNPFFWTLEEWTSQVQQVLDCPWTRSTCPISYLHFFDSSVSPANAFALVANALLQLLVYDRRTNHFTDCPSWHSPSHSLRPCRLDISLCLDSPSISRSETFVSTLARFCIFFSLLTNKCVWKNLLPFRTDKGNGEVFHPQRSCLLSLQSAADGMAASASLFTAFQKHGHI